MNSEDFCTWLKGMFDLGSPDSLSADQMVIIQDHLRLVFKYSIDPSYPLHLQSALFAAHEGR